MENKKEMNLCRLGEGVRLTDKSSVHQIQIIVILLWENYYLSPQLGTFEP
jgi:hypothetical protein